MNWALRPLVRLRNDIRTRRPDDLTPLDATRVPSEVAPLVEAVNHHIARHRRVLDEQSQFLADASHQLRTPLAIMLTQAQYALRERDPVRAQEGLRAIVDQLGRTRCLTEQLLSLAHASQADAPPRQELDLNDVARDVVLQYLPLAHEKQQDLGWVDARGDEAEGASDTAVVPVWGSEVELHEALSNLVHNAINYARRGRTSRYRSCATPAAPRCRSPTMAPASSRYCAPGRLPGSTAWRATAMRRRRDRGWGCRLPVPMRGATMAISNCATASPTPRAGSDCAPCSGFPCTTRARRPTRPRRSGAAAERLASNASLSCA